MNPRNPTHHTAIAAVLAPLMFSAAAEAQFTYAGGNLNATQTYDGAGVDAALNPHAVGTAAINNYIGTLGGTGHLTVQSGTLTINGNDIKIGRNDNNSHGTLTVASGATLNLRQENLWGGGLGVAGNNANNVSGTAHVAGTLHWFISGTNEQRVMIGNGGANTTGTVNINGGTFTIELDAAQALTETTRCVRVGSGGNGDGFINLASGTFRIVGNLPFALGGSWTNTTTTPVFSEAGGSAGNGIITINNGDFEATGSSLFEIGANDYLGFTTGGNGKLSILGWDSTTDPGYTKFKALIDAGKVRIDTFTVTPGDYSRFLFSDASGQGVLKIDNSSLLAPEVISDPIGQVKFVGQTATFTAQASGNPSPGLQWEISTNDGVTWSPISGATSSSYTTPVITYAMNEDLFRMVATNTVGSVTTLEAALLVDFPAPTINTQPVNILANKGESPAFTVTATGADPANHPLQYQWQKSTDLGLTWTNLSGETSASLVVANVQPADAALFRVIVTDTAASAESLPPTETISNRVHLQITDPAAGFVYLENSAMVYDGSTGGIDEVINPRIVFDNDVSIGNNAAGSLTVNGGSLTLNNVFLWSPKLGQQLNGAGTVTVNAGTLTVNDAGNDNEARFMIGATATGVLNLNGGSMLVTIGADDDVDRGFYIGKGTNGTRGGTVNLSGGSLFYPSDAPVYFGCGPAGAQAAYGVMNISDGSFAVTGTDQVSFGGADDYLNFATGDTGSISISGWDSVTDPGYTRFKALVDAGNVRVNGIAIAAGDYSPFLFSDADGSGVMKIDPSYVGSPYLSWAAANAGGQGADLDHDQDGVSNGIEFFMNSAAGFTALPAVSSGSVTWPNGGNIPSTAYGTQFVVETSANLALWTDIPANNPGLSNTAGAVTYTLPTGEGKIFVRLAVTPN